MGEFLIAALKLFVAVVFLFIFIFFNRLFVIYDFGQKVVGNVFKCLAPLDKFFTNLFPFYFLITVVSFLVFTKLLKLTQFNHQFMFLFSFTLTMHILNLAVELQEQEQNFIKPNYYMVMCLTLIVEVLLVILLFDLVFSRAAINEFVPALINDSKDLYIAILKKITAM